MCRNRLKQQQQLNRGVSRTRNTRAFNPSLLVLALVSSYKINQRS